MKTIIEVILVIGAFSQSFWLGIFTVAYLIYIKEDYKNLRTQLEAAISEEKKQPEPKITGMPVKIYPYKDCVIEEHRGSMFRIMKPSSEILDKVFYTLKDAEKEIDVIYPYLPKIKRRRRKIYNIRRV